MNLIQLNSYQSSKSPNPHLPSVKNILENSKLQKRVEEKNSGPVHNSARSSKVTI